MHATGEPGTLYAVQAGVESVDHADQLSDETMRLMHEKGIPAVPTFAIVEYFADHAAYPGQLAERERKMQALHAQSFKKQLAAGVPMAVGSDVGPFPHGTQAREFELMVQYGMSPVAVLAGRPAERREAAGLGGPDRRSSSRATSPTSLLYPAIPPRTSAR